MVLSRRSTDMEDTMPQTVPSAGFTPPCDYSNFADNFDLSLLPGSDPVSPSTQFYTQSPPYANNKDNQPKIFTTFYPSSPEEVERDLELGPDFQKLLVPAEEDSHKVKSFPQSPVSNIYLEVPSSHNYPSSPVGALSPYSQHSSQGLLSPNDQFTNYRQSNENNFYPSSPELSLYTPSPNSIYSRSPGEDYFQANYIKKEQFPASPLPPFSPFQIKEESYLSPCHFSSPTSPAFSNNPSSPQQPDTSPDVLNLLEKSALSKQIKQEDFGGILQSFQDTDTLRQLLEQDLTSPPAQIVPDTSQPKDHQLLREVLRDTSYQKKYNIRPFDFGGFFNNSGEDVKMEEEDKCGSTEGDLINNEQLTTENIEPVFNLAFEQMRKEVDLTCAALGISPDPAKWDSSNVLSWLRWASRQLNLPEPESNQWDMTGANLMALSEEDFTRKAPQGGMNLHAQLEIWKAAYSDENLGMNWLPETASSNASSGDISEEEDEDTASPADPVKPTSSRTGGSHIHLWQFLKELLASPQTHGSCIRWLDRTKGIFKIEDSVKVARLWGKRKNRPAMNYDKLSRSIRQYYKKGIMKKTERSQRLVYQFCHPYNL